MTIRTRLQKLERLVTRARRNGCIPLEKTLADLKGFDQWLSQHDYSSAQEAFENGETGPEGSHFSLPEMVRVERESDRLEREARAELFLQTDN
jgi:hypothetical protein